MIELQEHLVESKAIEAWNRRQPSSTSAVDLEQFIFLIEECIRLRMSKEGIESMLKNNQSRWLNQ